MPRPTLVTSAVLLLACTRNGLAQTDAHTFQAVVPENTTIPQGAKFNLGYMDVGNSEEAAFRSTRICVFAANGTDVANCKRPHGSSSLFMQITINQTTGGWDFPNRKTCTNTSAANADSDATFDYDSASWSPGQYTAVFERALLIGHNGTTRELDPSRTKEVEWTCVYPPFSSEILQTNVTITVVPPSGKPTYAPSITSAASFATATPRTRIEEPEEPAGAAALRATVVLPAMLASVLLAALCLLKL